MAGTNTSEIRLAGVGRLYVAAAGTAVPETVTDGNTAADWGADWKDLGYTSGEGVTFSKKDKLEPVDVWQAVSPVHFVYSDRDLTLKFSLLQFNEDTLPFFMGGGAVSALGGTTPTGVYKYDIADRPYADARALGLEFTDKSGSTDVTYRFGIPRGQVTAADDIKLARKAPAQLGITFTAMATPDGSPLASFVMKDSSYAAG
ncbi:phage tail protein [Streptomyces sp. TRM70350]|uniref:phage tail tube protein n=1 Tax=Streptomyces sp. TRM70350 TaxID=2856165 RepID=UPI001C48EF49|nr:phage tail protein [Streptomyces sp. TRM70350]MBV7697012.1 phage tail protein [Streptomyces sp. TRM70350]